MTRAKHSPHNGVVMTLCRAASGGVVARAVRDGYILGEGVGVSRAAALRRCFADVSAAERPQVRAARVVCSDDAVEPDAPARGARRISDAQGSLFGDR